MKIVLGFVIGILVLTAGGSGYFIWDLIGQVESLEQSQTALSGEIEATAGATRALLEESDAANKALIEETNESLALFSSSTSEQFSSIERSLSDYQGSINSLVSKAGVLETITSSSVLQTRELFDQAKEAMVRISDGTSLLGSGFVVSSHNPDDVIKKVVTAYHVVEDIVNCYISLYDGRTWKGFVWAYSKEADIAILNFTATLTKDLPQDLFNLPSLQIADSLDVRPGDPVFVIGSPGDDQENRLGLRETVTSGIVSQINRGATIRDQYRANLIQFDAAANFGNSGGPLLNREGKVIGVVIARMNPLYGDGISFASPSNLIKKVTDTIVFGQSGQFTFKYPWTGIAATDISPKDIVATNNEISRGLKVTNATWPASTAGVMVDDIILMIDDRMIRDSDEFYSVLADYYEIGDSIILEIRRDGQPVSVTLVIGEKP